MTVHLVIVDNLYLGGFAVFPDETDAPLVVDADTVLTLAVALERFEPVAGRRPQIVQFHCLMQKEQLTTATRSILLKRGTSTSLNKASVSLHWND